MAIAIPIAMLAIGAATSAAAASAKNKAIKKSMQASVEASKENTRQVTEAGQVEALKRRNEAAMIRARLRVSGAEAGVGDGTDTLLAQANYDEALNQNLLDRNVVNEQRRIASGLNADLTNLHGQSMNGILSAITGGIQGFSTGLQIQSALPKGDGAGSLGSSPTGRPGAGDAYVANTNQRFA